MSPDIWTECAGVASVGVLRLEPYRVVEAQHVNATRKLVDSDSEQELLESLIDDVKPRALVGGRFDGLHYLLSTPFRYPPLRYGSRFGTCRERGIWYGAREVATALAEVAYYRLLFLDGTRAELGPVTSQHSVFQASIATERGVDLTRPPFDRTGLRSPVSYAATQPLGAAMRAAGVEAFVFTSARDPLGGHNVGLFEPCFARRQPSMAMAWVCTATRAAVELKRSDLRSRERHRFERAQFEVDGRLPAPGAVA